MTADQVKQKFKDQGVVIKEWADRHGFKPVAVCSVLNGAHKARRGKAHDIAVALGIKTSTKA